MGWSEVLKELLKSVSTIIRDIPIWAKTVICLLVFGVLTFLLVANAQQMFVFQIELKERPEPTEGVRYLILHAKTGYQTPYETSNNDIVRATVPVRVGLLETLEGEFRIQRRTTTSGQGSHPVNFKFGGPRPWQSDVIAVSLVCDFSGRSTCAPEPTSSDLIPLPARGVAHAADAPAPHLNVPTIETLRELPPDGGYMEVRLGDVRIDQSQCGKDCSGAVFSRIDWNGVSLFFDGIPPDATRNNDIEITKSGELSRSLSFGIENTLFREGTNVLRLTFYTRGPLGGGFRRYEQLIARETPRSLDVLETELEVLRKLSLSIKGRAQLVRGELHVNPISGRLGRSRELFIGSGTVGEVTAKREFVNESLAKRVTLGGNRIVGVIRPPLKSNPLWGLAVGVVQPKTDRVRLLLSEDEAKSLLADLRRMSDRELMPLKREEFFIQQVASN